jgi:hypothetical protein
MCTTLHVTVLYLVQVKIFEQKSEHRFDQGLNSELSE